MSSITDAKAKAPVYTYHCAELDYFKVTKYHADKENFPKN